MHAYVCACVHEYLCACVHACMGIYVRVCVYMCVSIYAHMCANEYNILCVCELVCMCVCVWDPFEGMKDKRDIVELCIKQTKYSSRISYITIQIQFYGYQNSWTMIFLNNKFGPLWVQFIKYSRIGTSYPTDFLQ